MSIVYALLIAIVTAVAILMFMASRKPDNFRISRSIQIAAPPARIYPLIADLRGWTRWSPWQERDPKMAQSFSDPAEGVGAWMAWEGDRNVGTGRVEIEEATPFSRVVYKLNFVKPFKAENRAEFRLVETIGGTEVVWELNGPSPLMSKVMDVIMNMERIVGRDFEQGLAKLKQLAEA